MLSATGGEGAEGAVKLRTQHSVEQLERLLLLRLFGGEFLRGELLPSRADLAKEYGVCPNTAGAALGRLVARGLCEARTGVGTWPLGDAPRLDARALAQLLQYAEQLAAWLSLLGRAMAAIRAAIEAAAPSSSAPKTPAEHPCPETDRTAVPVPFEPAPQRIPDRCLVLTTGPPQSGTGTSSRGDQVTR